MTKGELFEQLKKDGFPEDRYSLEGGLFNCRLCLERKNNRWYIYYCENGIRINEKDFFIEELACQYFYNELGRLHE